LGKGKQTNQRAELMAIKIALEIARRNQKVLIRSDSIYFIEGITNWGFKWQRASWRKPAGIFMANRDLIDPIAELLRVKDLLQMETKFFWVKGHSGDPGNEAADKLALQGLEVSYQPPPNSSAMLKVVKSCCVMCGHTE
jgi:ribonuclease HI